MDPGGRAATTSDLANWAAIQTTAAISSATLYNRTVTPFLSSILGLFFYTPRCLYISKHQQLVLQRV
jgi:hypothetical protein